MNIVETIHKRRSVRSFNGEALTSEQIASLNEEAKNAIDPFRGKVSIRLKQFDLKEGYKPSTYGMIKGAVDFFLLGIGSDEASALSAGFRFEQVVLKACDMGLGTCWIAATFKGSDFDRGETWPDGEELKIICPVGVAAKPRMLEKVGRMALGSNKRKPFGELFFTNDFKSSYSVDSHFGEPLEMMRLAPSSTNSQPWRALVDGESVHFYYKPKSPASILDCGIGMSHFYLTEKYLRRDGEFLKDDPGLVPPEDWKYLYTFKEK